MARPFRGAVREALSARRGGESGRGRYRYRAAMDEVRPLRGGRTAAAYGAPLWCGRERESSTGLRGISEHPEERASDGALFSDARVCRKLAGGGRGEGLFGRELRTLGCHSHY